MQRYVFTLAIVALLGATLVRAFDEKVFVAKFMEFAEQCKADVGATDADVESAAKPEPVKSYEAKCLRACVMKKFNMMGENGKLDVNGGREKAKQITKNDPAKLKVALEIGDFCAAISVPEDHCEAAEAYSICFKDEVVKRGLM